MKERGIGTTADVLFLTLMVSVACLLLIGFPSIRSEGDTSGYAERTAQNTLLAFQRVPVEEFGNFSYTPDLPVENPSERTLGRKTVTQLIAEGVLLNPQWKVDNKLVSIGTNYKYEEKLGSFLDSSLEKFVGKRFGFRLIIRLNPVRLSENEALRYQKFVEDFDEDSKKLCSESISLDLAIPQNWLNGSRDTQDKNSGGKVGTLNLTLELWSR